MSAPISVNPDMSFGYNIYWMLRANNSALMDFTIQPGESWSFNEAVGNPEFAKFVSINDIPASGWCDGASRWVQASRPILPATSINFQLHGVALNQVDYNDSVVIWNEGGKRGGEDLIITNTTNRPIHYRVIDNGDQTVSVTATVE